MTVLTPTAPPGYTRGMHPLLAAVRDSRTRAETLRVELEAAQREHHDAILAAANEVEEDDLDGLAEARFTIAEIASAAGISRGRVYKHLGKPIYGDRSAAKVAYQ